MTLMDLLLQAAKVLELENSDVSTHRRVTSKSTRGAHFHQYAKARGDNSENSDGSASYGENGAGASEDDNPLPQRRRTGGKSADHTGSKRQYSRRIKQLIHPFTVAGTREVHNQLEKNRRKQLRECFNHLQQCVPSLENKRVATQSILQGAIKHIKNLKKKDVEQEREIHMLANKKCELKKRYDCELNKCSEEQQHLADVFLKIMKSKADDCEDNGHLSDSTTTASEGPELSDDERKPMNSFALASKVEGSRKRKLGPRATLGYAGRSENLAVSHSSGGISQQVNSKASTVSSSSMALKHMLEQRKKNKMSVAAQGKTSWLDKVMKPAAPMTKGPMKSVSSLTSSYPMISTHLASGLKPAISSVGHIAVTATNSHLFTQAAVANISVLGNNLTATANSNLAKAPPAITPASTKRRKASGNNDNTVQHTLLNQHTALPQTTFKKQYRAPPSTMALHQPMGPAIKLSEANSVDQSQLAAAQTINVDIQNISYLGKNIMGTNSGTLAMAPISQSLEGSKLLSAVSLASFIRNLPISAVVPPIVSLAPTQITMAPSSQASTTPVSSSLLTNQLQPALNANLLFTNTSKSEANQLTTVPLSNNTARIATLLAAPSPHLHKGVLKPTSSLPNSSTCQIVASSSSSTLTLHDNMKTMTLTPTLLPISLNNGSLSNSSNSSGTQLRFFTPFSHNSMMAASLGNGQTMLPAMLQLGASGQVLLQNLIPTQHVPHHQLLGQPIVVMTTPGASYNVTSAGGTTTTVSSPSTVL